MRSRNHIEDEDERRKIVRDGEKVVVRMHLMDGVQRAVMDAAARHEPDYAVLSDAEREARRATYDAYDESVGAAWRPAPAAAPAAMPADCYAAYEARVADGWRAAP